MEELDLDVKIESVFGLLISLTDEDIERCLEVSTKPANRNVEVLVRLNGEEKEFTFREFFKRLGFEGGVK